MYYDGIALPERREVVVLSQVLSDEAGGSMRTTTRTQNESQLTVSVDSQREAGPVRSGQTVVWGAHGSVLVDPRMSLS
jgi:hypothetical protein